MLGQLGELAARSSQQGSDLDAAARLAYPTDDRSAELAPDGDRIYLRTADGAAAMGRLLDGSVRRLVPTGWKSPVLPRHAADGSVLGVCGYRLGGERLPAVAADGFAWSSDGDSVAVSSPAGILVVKQTDVVYTTASPVTGTVVAWPSEGAP